MKNSLKIIALFFLITSCTDLDLEPLNGEVESVAFDDFEGYQSLIAKVYGSLTLTGQQGADGEPDLTIITDEGFSSYLRVWWKAQELTTDEALIAWEDSGIRDLHDHKWGSENQFVRVLYYRIFFTIALANDFLRVSEELPDALSNEEINLINQYRNEARYIRALSYWHALDHFRNVSLYTSVTSEAQGQVSPNELFEFIESEMNELEASEFTLPANSYQDPSMYGRVNAAAIWMLKAKIYLNAGVYIGEDKYTECLTEVNKVINSGVFSIHDNYLELFNGDNHLRTNEIIWSIVHDGLVSQTWGGTTTIVRAAIGGAMEDDDGEAEANYGVPGGWGGYRTTREFANLFPEAITNNGITPDGRGVFFTEGQTLDIQEIGEFTNGWAIPKFTNLESSTGQRAPGVDQVSTDFPVFRYADAYLMYTESVLRGGIGGDLNTALNYMNQLRQRAYGDQSGDISTADLNLDFILDERGRELYLESTRRTDLIRFGQFSGGAKLWAWKGGVQSGVATDSKFDLFPIPQSDLVVNPKLVQNPGY